MYIIWLCAPYYEGVQPHAALMITFLSSQNAYAATPL